MRIFNTSSVAKAGNIGTESGTAKAVPFQNNPNAIALGGKGNFSGDGVSSRISKREIDNTATGFDERVGPFAAVPLQPNITL